MGEPVSIDTSTPEPETATVSIDTNAGEPGVSPEIAVNRASRAHFGLNDFIPKTWDEYYQPIAAGQELSLRKEVAAQLDFQKNIRLHQMISTTANQLEGPLTPADYVTIQQHIYENRPTDPLTVFESNFASKYVNSIYANNNPDSGSWFNDVLKSMPNIAQTTTAKGERYQSFVELLRKFDEEADATYNSQSWGGWTVDQIKSFTQLYPEYKLRGLVPGADFALGLGSAIEAQAQKAFEAKDLETFRAIIEPPFRQMLKDNPSLAKQWISALIGQSLGEKALNNVFTFLAVPDIALAAQIGRGVGTGIYRQVSLYNQLQSAQRTIIANSANLANRPVPVVTAAATGNLTQAAVVQSASDTMKIMRGTLDPMQQSMGALTDALAVDRQTMRTSPGRFGQEIVNRLAELSEQTQNVIGTIMENVWRVNRTPSPLAIENITKAVWEDIKTNYRGKDNSILNMSKPQHNHITNTYDIDVHLGNADGTFFESREQALGNAELNGLVIRSTPEELNLRNTANQYAKFSDYRNALRAQGIPDRLHPIKGSIQFDRIRTLPLRPEGYTIEQEGLGHYIKYTKPYKETDQIIRDGLLATEEAKLPEVGPFKAALTWIRTPEEVLSREENAQRKIATHAPAVLEKAARRIIAEPLRKLPMRYRKDFNRLLKAGQKKLGEDSIPGYTFKTPGEIEGWYQTNLSRLPEQSELKAYWAWKNVAEFDGILRDIEEFKNRSRQGSQSHNVSVYAKGSTTDKVSTGFFDGMILKKLPGGDNHTLVVMGTYEGNEKIYNSHQIPPKIRERLDKDILSGKRKILEIYDTESRPMQGFGSIKDQKVRYVVSNAVETKPLSYNQVARRGGGHLVPDYNYYISQAKVKMEQIGEGLDLRIRHWYEGDANVMPIAIQRMGADVAKKMDDVRLLLKAGDVDAARALHTQHKLPMTWDEHHGWYKPSRDPKGREVAPRLNLEERIQVRSKDTRLIDQDPSIRARYERYKMPDGTTENTFNDGTRVGSAARANQTEFTSPRDHYELYTITNKGSAKNPLYSYEPGNYIDPITIMNRGLNRIINSTFMSDMKIYSVEHWLQQARPHLRWQDFDKDIMSSPFWNFHHPVFVQGLRQDIKNQLMSTNYMIKQFVGQPSSTQQFLNALSQKLVDATYGKNVRVAMYLNEHLPYAKDPLTIARTLTYHWKMGLFALPQFFTQATTFSNVLAISPRHAPAAAYATLIHSWASVNSHLPFLRKMDLNAARFGWRPGELLEAMQELRNSGFGQVGVEHALQDHPMGTKVVKSGTGMVVSAGEKPFQMGAEFVRASAFYTAYREFRHGGGGFTWGKEWAGSNAALTDADRTNILARAALLDHNMSRAGSSLLHTGIMAPMGQFLAYNLRLTEMFFGKRLTPMEKTRLFGISSILYGIPAGGIGLLAFPAEDIIRQKAQEWGYGTNENKLVQFLRDGLPALMTSVITGKDYDIYKWGTKGLDPLAESFSSDKTLWDIFGGASMGTAVSLFKQSRPFFAAMGGMLTGDPKSFPLKINDFVDMLREIKSINVAWTAYVVASTGQWLSRNETLVKDGLNMFDAMVHLTTGLHPTAVPEVYLTEKSIRDRDHYHKTITNLAVKEFQRGVRIAAGNPENEGQANDYFIRFNAWLQLIPYEDRHKVMQQAAEGLEKGLVERVPSDFWLKHVTPDTGGANITNYIRTRTP